MTTHAKKEEQRYKNRVINRAKWGVRSTLSVCIFLILATALSLLLFKHDLIIKHSSNWNYTSGNVISVESINEMSQNRLGNSINVTYRITYTYRVDSVTYIGTILGRHHPDDNNLDVYYKVNNHKSTFVDYK